MFIMLNSVNVGKFLVRTGSIDVVVSHEQGAKVLYSDGQSDVVTQSPSAVFELIRKEEKKDATE